MRVPGCCIFLVSVWLAGQSMSAGARMRIQTKTSGLASPVQQHRYTRRGVSSELAQDCVFTRKAMTECVLKTTTFYPNQLYIQPVSKITDGQSEAAIQKSMQELFFFYFLLLSEIDS